MLVNAVFPSRGGRLEAGDFLQPPASLRSAERDFLGLPIRAYSFANRRRSESFGCQEASARTLVEALGLCAGGVPFLVEPVQNGFVIGNAPAAFRRRMMKTRSGGGSCRWHGQSGASAIHPFDCLPRWLDGLHGVDLEGRRWRAREMAGAEDKQFVDVVIAPPLAGLPSGQSISAAILTKGRSLCNTVD